MPKPKSDKNYFTQQTEDAIVKYNTTEDPDVKAKLFEDEIYTPFYKLAENIIHTFKFYYTDVDDIEDLKHKIITVLLEEKIHKFDPSYGAKAYSYFGTIVKRWLISYNNKNYKKLLKKGTLDEYDAELDFINENIDTELLSLSQIIDRYIEDVYDNLEEMFPKKTDQQIADSILTIFKTREDLQVFRKKALYIYIREITDCKTPHLTKVIKILKSRFYKLYYELQDKGLIEG